MDTWMNGMGGGQMDNELVYEWGWVDGWIKDEQRMEGQMGGLDGYVSDGRTYGWIDTGMDWVNGCIIDECING